MILEVGGVCPDAGADAEWLQAQVPLLECPDPQLQRIYHFRWRVFRRHLRRTPDGWVVTEFLPPVPWAGRHHTIGRGAGLRVFVDGRERAAADGLVPLTVALDA